MIPDADRQNFNMLCAAFKDGNVTLLEAIRRSDEKQVSLIISVHQDENQTFNIIPFAVMVEGNPYDDYLPATAPDYPAAEKPQEPAPAAPKKVERHVL